MGTCRPTRWCFARTREAVCICVLATFIAVLARQDSTRQRSISYLLLRELPTSTPLLLPTHLVDLEIHAALYGDDGEVVIFDATILVVDEAVIRRYRSGHVPVRLRTEGVGWGGVRGDGCLIRKAGHMHMFQYG